MERKKETFTYMYSAAQQDEVKKIRQKYLPKEITKIDELRHLDKSVEKAGTLSGILTGIFGTLLFGIGMCCTMVWAEQFFIPGILIGIIGIAGMIAAYPIYKLQLRKRREKLAPKILELTEELIKQ